MTACRYGCGAAMLHHWHDTIWRPILSVPSVPRAHFALAAGAVSASAFPGLYGYPSQSVLRDHGLSRTDGRCLPRPPGKPATGAGVQRQRTAHAGHLPRRGSGSHRLNVAWALSSRAGGESPIPTRPVRRHRHHWASPRWPCRAALDGSAHQYFVRDDSLYGGRDPATQPATAHRQRRGSLRLWPCPPENLRLTGVYHPTGDG